ncbi:C6 zinc finger domain protein [Cladophialophora carrionii]|uniref:C6 zinc finger domain protein n=1 Tax=Cladophialophora carrionii TaxID=86049 RepID=A0A1C1C9Q1_9EURO|nr:C6 zinc finger domain protein [Cladophialophora carrionii]
MAKKTNSVEPCEIVDDKTQVSRADGRHDSLLQSPPPLSDVNAFPIDIFQVNFLDGLPDRALVDEGTLDFQWSTMGLLEVDDLSPKSHQISHANDVSTDQLPSPTFDRVHQPTRFDALAAPETLSHTRPGTKAEQLCLASSKPRQEDDLPSPGRPLNDLGSMLVEYYFKEVAGLFSCYDSPLNPFRTSVSRLWRSSAAVMYTVQSMAAACLTDVCPTLRSTGFRMREKAAACVEADMRLSKVDTGTFLVLIMLGLSASWHQPNDLGRKEFEKACTIVDAIHAGGIPKIQEDSNGRNLQFFHEAMIYWEMLMSYVSDITMPPSQSLSLQTMQSEQDYSDIGQPSFPHPWTGVAREAQSIVFEIGRLVRRERLRLRNPPFFTSVADLDTGQKAFNTAVILAYRLLNLKLPTEATIVNPGDAQTPVRHLLTIGEAYRLAGLLQLYRVFPDISQGPDNEGQCETRSGRSPCISDQSRNLSRMALEITGLLRTIPIESRTRCVQPFLLVAAASELRPEAYEEVSPPSEHHNSAPDDASALATAIEVLEARKFVIGRLSTFEHVLPAKPIRQMMEIVKHTWDRMDMGQANVYWMDVMIEKGWETTMG